MEDLIIKLQKSWESIDYYSGGSLQIDVEHLLDWHVAYLNPNSKALVVISDYQLKSCESSKCIAVSCNYRKDKKYYISFELTDETKADVFLNMCADLIRFSSVALTQKDAIQKVEKRFAQWRRLMERKNKAIMSTTEQKGLIGELMYLSKMIREGLSIDKAIEGWVGPNGADQDFVYDRVWREIKTTTLSSNKVVIHSIEQLGDFGDRGNLIVYRIDKCAPESEGAFTLRTAVKELLNVISDDENNVDKFIMKLNNAGYIDSDEYDKEFYKYYSEQEYLVSDDFPRLTRKSTRAEIIECEYKLSISSIEPWKKVN